MHPLSVAVPADRFHMSAKSGAGRVWNSVLAALEGHADVRPLKVEGRSLRDRLRGRPDVWLSGGHEGAIFPDEPVVAICHGAAWCTEPSFWDLIPPYSQQYAEAMVESTEATLRCASLVITPSEYTRRQLVDGVGLAEDTVVAVSHGVDAETFHPGRRGGRALVAQALGEDRPYVLFASIPTNPHKNLDLLREVMGRLAARGLPHALVIAGGPAGDETAEAIERVSAELPGASGRVAWLGFVGDDDLAALMAEADAYCLPSLIESFGLTALEALACGAPVVVADRGALPEVVGDAALRAQPTAEALEQALLRVLTDDGLPARLRAAGRAHAEGMSWARTAAGWLSVLERAAAAPQQPAHVRV